MANGKSGAPLRPGQQETCPRSARGARRIGARGFAAVRLLIWGLVPALVATVARSTPVRVGVYENDPIVYRDAEGRYQGVAIDVLRYVAAEEGWTLDYVPCVWSDCLDALVAGRLDLQVGIAFSTERSRTLRFGNEGLVSNWGVIFRRRGVDVTSILDLEGKRVAVLAENIHARALAGDLERFGIEAELVPCGAFAEVLDRVERGEADAGVVNRLFTLQHAGEYAAVPTGIVFDPVEIRFAEPLRGDGRLVAALDRHLRRLKDDPNSVYQRSLRRYLTVPQPWAPSPRLKALLMGGVLVLLLVVLGNILLRRQVRHRTAELERTSRELRRQVAERRAAQTQLRQLTFFDGLTGLPNRFLFRDRLKHALAHPPRDGSGVALLHLDLDRFKGVVDSFGPTVAEEVLREVGARLVRSAPEADTVGRLGGDEFTVVVPADGSIEEVEALAQHIQREIRAPIVVGEERVWVSASIGVAFFPRDAIDPEGLRRCADAALHYVKTHGRGGVRLFSPELSVEASRRRTLEAEVRSAVERGALVLHYQPIVELKSREVTGVEALVRLPLASGDWRKAEEFVPLAEESGLIGALGRQILEMGVDQLAAWDREGFGELYLALNISSRQLGDAGFLDRIDEALERASLGGHRLEVEVTESLLVEGGPARLQLLRDLRSRGVRISVDDFGTGYSSLSYLQRLPLDILKIDRSFIESLGRDERSEHIVRAILALARELELRVVAEGVESATQLAFLVDHGCELGQGHYFGRAEPPEALGPRLRDSQRRRAG